MHGSDAVFPPTLPNSSETRGGHKAQHTHNNCLYNHAEKLPMVYKESPSGPKHYYKHCSKNCTSIYRHHGKITTNCTVAQYTNDYSYNHTVNSTWPFGPPHSKYYRLLRQLQLAPTTMIVTQRTTNSHSAKLTTIVIVTQNNDHSLHSQLFTTIIVTQDNALIVTQIDGLPH